MYFGSSFSSLRVNRDPWPVSSGADLNLSSLGGPTGAWGGGGGGPVRRSVWVCEVCVLPVCALPSPLKKKASESRSKQLGCDEEREVVEGQSLWWAPSRRVLRLWRSLVGHW